MNGLFIYICYLGILVLAIINLFNRFKNLRLLTSFYKTLLSIILPFYIGDIYFLCKNKKFKFIALIPIITLLLILFLVNTTNFLIFRFYNSGLLYNIFPLFFSIYLLYALDIFVYKRMNKYLK